MKSRLLAGALAMLCSAAAAGDVAGVLERVAPSIVTVKVVLRLEMTAMGQAQNEESRSELNGVVVDDAGLVMISNAEISADRLKEAMAGNPMASQIDITVIPTEFQVIFENEQEEYPAYLVAKDTKLDLAFIQVEDLGGRTVTPVDFTGSVKPAMGAEVVAVSRMKKGYDYAPHFTAAQVSGSIRKPRKAWTIDGTMAGYGLPVFMIEGEVVGVLVTLAPTTREESPGGGFGSMMRFMRGGMVDTGVGTFVLPGNVVRGLIEQAQKEAEELREEMEEQEASSD